MILEVVLVSWEAAPTATATFSARANADAAATAVSPEYLLGVACAGARGARAGPWGRARAGAGAGAAPPAKRGVFLPANLNETTTTERWYEIYFTSGRNMGCTFNLVHIRDRFLEKNNPLHETGANMRADDPHLPGSVFGLHRGERRKLTA